MRIGIDFGTTNSGAAFFNGDRVHLFPVDPASADPTVIRSMLYITADDVYVGKEALDKRPGIDFVGERVVEHEALCDGSFGERGGAVADRAALQLLLVVGELSDRVPDAFP